LRLLLIHADYLEFEVKKPTPAAEKISDEQKSGRADEALVAFIAVEDVDKTNSAQAAENASREIGDVYEKVEAQRVVLYPYAHLSQSLAPPKVATQVLDSLREKLESRGLEVLRLPFGWYKAFKLSCKGHPLSELSRTIPPTEAPEEEEPEVVSEALRAEEKAKSEWYIMDLRGDLIPVDKFDFRKHQNLEKFARYEMAKVREVKKAPPHVKLMRRLELVDHEAGSDSGNLRYYPKGRLVKGLLEEYVDRKSAEYGAMEVETPVMYDFEHPAMMSYLHRFPARQYIVESVKKNYFLRFSACFGQFLIESGATISYKDLPLKMYELAKYSFRREKSGELAGLRRLRAFTMPDLHTLCRGMKQALAEYKKQFNLCLEVLKDIGLDAEDYEVAIRFTKEFYDENKEFIQSLVKVVSKPVLIEIWSGKFFYFVLKFEFNFVDALEKASALSTVQIDVENAKRYGISFVDEKGEEKHPIILHCSPSGAIERGMYALLEKAYLNKKRGKQPSLPLWLSPTQVRLIPVTERHLKQCSKFADVIGRSEVRIDIDDRDLTVAKKVRDAEREWVSYVVVVGDKEIKTKKLPARVRGLKRLKSLTAGELATEIRRKTEGMPFKPLTLPRLLSLRPIFVGA
jgi:threonyl-tRNA synthetase